MIVWVLVLGSLAQKSEPEGRQKTGQQHAPFHLPGALVLKLRTGTPRIPVGCVRFARISPRNGGRFQEYQCAYCAAVVHLSVRSLPGRVTRDGGSRKLRLETFDAINFLHRTERSHE